MQTFQSTVLTPAVVFLLLSLVLGALVVWVGKRRSRRGPAAGAEAAGPVGHPELIRFEELKALEAAGTPYRLLDVRSPRSYRGADLQAGGAVRIAPDRPVESAAELALPKHDWLVAYCA